MHIVFLLVFVVIRVLFCGYTTKVINESKGYSGGFLMGILLAELGILIAAFKKEQPNTPPNSYRIVPVLNVLKKYHYPFVSPQVEPIDILKGNIYAEGEAAKFNLVFLLFHGFFMLGWYGAILGAYLWYLIGYTIYWLFKYKLLKKETPENFVSSEEKSKSGINTVRDSFSSLKDRAGNAVSNLSQKTEGVKTDAAEKAALAKEKAGAAFAALKDKATTFAAERKKSDNSDAPVDEVVEDINSVLSENYTPEEVTSTSDYIEEAPESESFDQLYEKAMNSFDEEEVYEEETTNEADDTENCYDSNEVEQPVAAPSVTQTPTPAANSYPQQAYPQSQNGYNPNGNNNVNQYTPQNYSYEEKKKSPVVFILIGVIAVLLVVAGILGGMLLMKNKNNKDSDNSGNNAAVSTTSDSENEISTSTVVDENNEFQTEISTEEIPTEPITENVADQYTSEEVFAMYSAYISENPDPNHTYDDPKYGYYLIDLNEDGTQELVITSDYIEYGSPDIEAVYAITQNRLEAIWLSDVRTYNFLCEGNIIQAEYIYYNGFGTVFYKYSSKNNLEIVESVTYDGTDYRNTGKYIITNNANSVITEEEANSILNQYKKMKFEAKQLNAASISVDKTEPTETTEPKKVSSLSEQELGYMYNMFYIQSLRGIGGGYIEDFDGDGTDEAILSTINGGYQICKYQNGELTWTSYPNGSGYAYNQQLPNMNTPFYDWNSISERLLELAISHGFTANKYFTQSEYFIGYVKTSEMFSTLNLRSAPSTNSNIVTQLPNGILFNVIGSYDAYGNEAIFYDNPAWYLIEVNLDGTNYTGYVSGDFVQTWDTTI